MNKRLLLAQLAFTLIAVFANATHAAAQFNYIVKYRQVQGVQRFGSSLGSLGGRLVRDLPLINAELFSLPRPLSTAELEAFGAQESSRIEYIEPDQALNSLATFPDDPYLYLQWGTHNNGDYGAVPDVDINAPEAWDKSTGSKDVVIVVLDTGVDYGHPDLINNLWNNPYEIPGNGVDDDANGYVDDIFGVNLVSNSGDPFDDQGHGTEVSGVIGAEGNNSQGIAGVNWNIRLINVKVLDAQGSGYTSNIIRGVHYAIDAKLYKGANVVAINASLGGPNYSRGMYDAIDRARSAGINFVAAAGNDGVDIDRTPSYPAAYNLDNIISVASVSDQGRLSSFSNYGYIGTDIAAPGQEVLTTIPRHKTGQGRLPYDYLDGTSFAAPYVAGVLGLLHAKVPNLTYRAAQNAIYRSAKNFRDVPELAAIDQAVGIGGMIDAAAALDYVIENDSDSDGDGVEDSTEEYNGTDPLDRGNFTLHLESPAFTKYNTFLRQQNYLELIAVGVKPIRAEVTVFAIDGSVRNSTTVLLDPSQQFHVDVNALVQQSDTYGLIRVDFNSGPGAQLLGRVTSYRPNNQGNGYSFAFTREFRNPLKGRSHVTSNSFDPQGSSTAVPNWIELINLDELPLIFTHNIYGQGGNLIQTQQLQVPAQGELDVHGGHVFGQGVYLNEFIPHNPRAPYFASLSRYRPNETGSDYTYAFSLDALAATGAEKYIPTFNRVGECFSQSNWVEVVNTSETPTPVTLTFRNGDSSLASQQSVTIPPKAQMHFSASAHLAKNSTGWVAVTPWAPESVISQGLVYYHDCRRNRLQTAFALPATEAHQNLLQGTFNQNLGIENIVSLINPNPATIPQGTVALYYPYQRIRYGFEMASLTSRLGFVNTAEDWGQNTYGTLEVLGSLQRPNNRMVVHNLLERPDGQGGVEFVIPTSVK